MTASPVVPVARVAAGVPTGGQFATQPKPEADLTLIDQPEPTDTFIERGERVNGTAQVGDLVHYFDIANQNRNAVRVENIVRDQWGTRYDLRDETTGEGGFSTLSQPGWAFAEIKPVNWCRACGDTLPCGRADCAEEVAETPYDPAAELAHAIEASDLIEVTTHDDGQVEITAWAGVKYFHISRPTAAHALSQLVLQARNNPTRLDEQGEADLATILTEAEQMLEYADEAEQAQQA